MMLEGRKTLVWGTIAAAVFSALWLGATDGSIPRLNAQPGAAERRDAPTLMRQRAPSSGPVSAAH
jgi:hypothetical protein